MEPEALNGQMKSFGPKKIQISCMAIWQFFRKADMALFNLCMKIKKYLGQMYSFEVVNNLNFMHGLKSAKSAFLKNCQNGTFLPMHENEKKFRPNDVI